MGTNSSNEIKIYTTSAPGGISGSNLNQVIEVTNNRARQYAEMAKCYMEQAKIAKNNAQYYAEQNSDVTKVYVDGIKNELLNLIDLRQPAGNYALVAELPSKVSELANDTGFITVSTLPSPDSSLDSSSEKPVQNKTIVSALNGKADINLTNVTPTSAFAGAMETAGISTIIESFNNNTSWYRIYSNGWCEQGGILDNCSSSNNYSVSLIKAYANTNYEILLSADSKGYQVAINIANYGNYQTTSSTFYIYLGKVASAQPDTSGHKICWMTCGFLPQV